MIGEAIDRFWKWFKGLLDIDVMAIAKNIPGASTLLGWMTTSKEEAAAEAAEEAAKELRKQKMRIKIQKAKNDQELRNRSARAEKLEKEIAKVEEDKAQSQLWID